MLVCLALIHCTGKKKASKGTAVRWFNQINDSRCVSGEDPAEDVFVTLVHDRSGNYRLLEGVWENAGFYTQCISDLVATLPDQEPFQPLIRSFRALLKISEEICRRAGLERYSQGDDVPHQRLESKRLPNKNSLVNRVTFTSSEFEEIGVSPSDIVLFLSYPKDHVGIARQFPGNNSLERFPLIQVGPDAFVMAMPSAISVCARNLVIDFIQDHDMEDKFDTVLADIYAHLIHSTPLVGGSFRAPVHWQKKESTQFATVGLEFDEGFMLSVHFFLPSVRIHQDGGFKDVFEDDGTISNALNERVKKSIESAHKNDPDMKGGLVLIVGCGWGKGYAVSEIVVENEDWLCVSVPVSDLVRISWVPDISPESFFRVQQGLKAAHLAGLQIFNINGFLNLIAWSRKNSGHIIPHELLVDAEFNDDAPAFLNIPQNLLRDLRWESDFGRDRHRAEDIHGKWHVVQRVSTGTDESSDGSHQLYASVDDIDLGTLSAVYDVGLPIWLSISAPNFQRRETLYRMWEMARIWLPRVVSNIEPVLAGSKEYAPLRIVLVFADSDEFRVSEPLPTPDELRQAVGLKTTGNQNEIEIHLDPGFMNGFRLPKNYAEQAIVGGILEAIFTHIGKPFDDDEIESLLKSVIKNEDARSFHAIQGHTFLQFVEGALPPKLVELNASDDALVKIGMGLPPGSPRTDNKIVGVDDCTSFIEGVVDRLLDRLHEELASLERRQMLLKIYANIEKGNAQEDQWRRTSAAIIGLHGENREGIQAYIDHSSKYSGAIVACRIVAEIALCACPLGSGQRMSNLELSRVMAITSLIYRLGGLSDAIKYNALPPELHVSPFGDILSKDDFGKFVVQPMLSNVIGQRFKELAPWQKKNYEEPEFVPSVKDKIDNEFWEIWTEEMGFDIDQARNIVESLEDHGVKNQKAVFELQRSELIELCENETVKRETVERFLGRFTLATRKKWATPPKGFAVREIYPWRLGRRLSLVARPILQFETEPDPTLIIAPNSIRQSVMYLISGAHSGRLGQEFFESSKMRNEWWGKASSGHAHTRSVANKLQDAGWQVRVEIGLPEILQRKMEQEFGDVDVLAWHHERNDVLIIECKDLSLARNYTEAAHLLSEYQGIEKNGELDNLAKHLRRFEILQAELKQVGAFCEVDSPSLHSALVFKGIVPMQYAKIDALKDTFAGDIESFISNLP